MADFADIEEVGEVDDSKQTSDRLDDSLFGTLMFLLRDYQASPTYGEDTGYFSAIVSVYIKGSNLSKHFDAIEKTPLFCSYIHSLSIKSRLNYLMFC